jgi:LysR family transcriptional regulator, nitrogen assimilation regulatory protein
MTSGAVDIRGLYYFVRIAELGSITRASAHLNVAQPALSRHVQRLEERLGVSLLVRESRGIRLTDAGQQLQEHASRILRELQRAEEEVRGSAASPSGKVILGVTPTLCPVITPRLFADIRETHPRIELKIAESASVPLVDWLIEGRVDLAVVTEPAPSRRLSIHPLAQEEMVLATARGSRRDGPVDPGDLDGAPLILSDGLRTILETLLPSPMLARQVILELNSIETIRIMVRQGTGESILPLSVLQADSEPNRLSAHRIGEAGLFRKLALVHAATRRLSAAGQAVMASVRAIFADLDERGAFGLEGAVRLHREAV